MTEKNTQPNNPLHGVKLAEILQYLVSTYGWEELGMRIKINCFTSNPTIKSSLNFLRKTPWARTFKIYKKLKKQLKRVAFLLLSSFIFTIQKIYVVMVKYCIKLLQRFQTLFQDLEF